MKKLTYLTLSALAWPLLLGATAMNSFADEESAESPAAAEESAETEETAADSEKPQRRARPAQADRPDRRAMRERMLKEFDADGDGELSGEERTKAREAMRERMQQRARGGQGRGGFDPGDRIERGVRPQRPGERRGPPPVDRNRAEGPRRRGGPEAGAAGRRRGGQPDPMRAFDHFDEDGDGMLSRDEFGRLAERMQQIRERMQGGPEEFRGPSRGPQGNERRGDFRRPPREGDRGEFRGPPPRGERARGGEFQRGPRGEGRRGGPAEEEADKTT